MARKKDPALEEERRATLSAAATELLAEESWRSVTLSAVARKAGVSKGVVTYWFSSKEELLLDALARYHGDYEERLLAIATRPIPVRERLIELLEISFPSQRAVQDEIRFQLELWSWAKENEQARAAIARGYDRFRMACQALLELGKLEGWVQIEDAASLYPYIHALLDGLSLQIANADEELDLPQMRADLLGLLEQWLRPGAAS